MVSRERLDAFVRGQCWAVVGASEDRSKFGNITFRELKRRGKQVYPVNPKATQGRGRGLLSLACPRCPTAVERVLIVVPPKLGEEVVKEAEAAGINHVWFQPGAESDEALAYCEAHGMEAIAGHCILRTPEQD